MKKLLVCLLSCLLVLSMFGCGKKDKEEPKTLGTVLQEQFEAEAKKTTDAETVIKALDANEAIDLAHGYMEVEEGYLNGFEGEITGFKKGFIIMPMIGTIPFVTYVFEADDANGLLNTLKDASNPRWNICTEAAETVYAVSGNLVFFAMLPAAED